MHSDHHFEGDLLKTKSLQSNISAASENLVVESLMRIREEVKNEKADQGVENFLDGSQPMFDQTYEISGYPSSNSTYTDKDNHSLKLMLHKIMVKTSTKGKEKGD